MKFNLNDKITEQLKYLGFKGYSLAEGRLMLMELIVRVDNNHYVSHSENLFVNNCGVLKRDNSPNAKGRKFLCDMLYASSNRAPEAYHSMKEFKNHD